MTRTVFLMLFAASTLAAVPHVQAQPTILVEGRPTIVVSYSDLNLSRAAGQAALNNRVRGAADRLCITGQRAIGPMMEERRCFNAALASAHPQIDRAIALYGTARYAGGSTLTVAGR